MSGASGRDGADGIGGVCGAGGMGGKGGETRTCDVSGMAQSFWWGMLGLMLPRGCAGCDKPDEVLCGDCQSLFRRHTAMPLNGIHNSVQGDEPGAGNPPDVLNGTASTANRQPFPAMIHAAGAYQGHARRAILSWKDHGDTECDKAFSQVCRQLVASSGLIDVLQAERLSGSHRAGNRLSDGYGLGSRRPGGCGADSHTSGIPRLGIPRLGNPRLGNPRPGIHAQVLVIPAPSTPKSMRARGRRHLWPLAKATAAELAAAGVEACAVNALRIRHAHGKAVETHSALGRAARLDGQLEVTDPGLVAGRSVLILDDIVTTGTTMRRCAEAIRGARGRVVGGLALAAVPPPAER